MQLGRIGITLISLIQFAIGATVSGIIELPGDELTNLDLVHTSIELLEIKNDQSQGLGLKRNAYINSEGQFNFNDIPTGSYLLSVSHIEYNLVPFKSRVDVLEDDQVEVHLVQAAQKWDERGPEIPQPIRYIPNTKFPERQYIKNRSPGILESGPIATVVNNPLYLGLAFFAIIAVVAPYLLEKFDPETAKILKEQKAQRNAKSSAAALKAAESLNFDLGDKIGSSRASNVGK